MYYKDQSIESIYLKDWMYPNVNITVMKEERNWE